MNERIGDPKIVARYVNHDAAHFHVLPPVDGPPIDVTYPDGCRTEANADGSWTFIPAVPIESETTVTVTETVEETEVDG